MFKLEFDDTFKPFGAPPKDDEALIFEASGPDASNVAALADSQFRAAAMSTALTWIEEDDHSYGALDALVVGMVDLDGNEEVDEDEEADYNDLLASVADALVRLGAAPDRVTSFIDDEDDDAGGKLGSNLAKKLDSVELSDDQIITRFATRVGEGILESAILEAAIKVVRNGKVVLKKKRYKKVRLSAAQRAALKKARRKANTAAARRNRAKAMRIRKQRGM